MNQQQLLEAVKGAAGLRLRLRLQPLYGAGEIVFPPTYAGGKYLVSKRRIPGYPEAVDCAILDSVQSQANRMEESLLADIRAGEVHLPHVETDFTDTPGLLKPVGKLTCFDCPHRVFDAILRDSIDGSGKHFPLSDAGDAVIRANARNATAIFSTSPASLLFGSWDSTGVSGGLGEKYTRCVVSEIVGVGAVRANRAGTRIDPLNAASSQSPDEILKATKDEMWARLAKSRKAIKAPSTLNHSSVPWDGGTEKDPHGGVTLDYIQQSTTVSFPALRQLSFPTADGDASPQAWAVLAAIALHAAALNVARGWHLRSRCDLILEDGAAEWELLGSGAVTRERLDPGQTRELLKDCIKAAKDAGLPWRDAPIRLKPSAALQQLVAKSQQSHRESSAEG